MKDIGNQDFFSSKQRQMLCSPGKWHIVSSLFQAEHKPCDDNAHRSWLARNSDSHPTREMLVVLEGKSLNSLNGLIYPATPGTIFLFDTYEKHDRFYSPETESSTHLWICLLKDRMIARMLRVDKGKFEGARKGELILVSSKICDLFDQEWSAMKNSRLAPALTSRKIRSLLSLLFIGMIEHDLPDGISGSATGAHQLQVMQAIHQHISSTGGKGMTLEKLARIAGYSKFHFCRLFRKLTGQNVHDCVNASRLRKTRKMLKEGFSQKQISVELGFSCPAAFSNWYALRKDS